MRRIIKHKIIASHFACECDGRKKNSLDTRETFPFELIYHEKDMRSSYTHHTLMYKLLPSNRSQIRPLSARLKLQLFAKSKLSAKIRACMRLLDEIVNSVNQRHKTIAREGDLQFVAYLVCQTHEILPQTPFIAYQNCWHHKYHSDRPWSRGLYWNCSQNQGCQQILCGQEDFSCEFDGGRD